MGNTINKCNEWMHVHFSETVKFVPNKALTSGKILEEKAQTTQIIEPTWENIGKISLMLKCQL